MIPQYDVREAEPIEHIITLKEWDRLSSMVRGCIVGDGSEVDYYNHLLCECNGNYCPFSYNDDELITHGCGRQDYSVRVLPGE